MVKEGQDVSFSCKKGKGIIMWYSTSLDEIVHHGETFKILSVSQKDQGYYECRGQTNESENFRALTQLDIEGNFNVLLTLLS